MNATSTPRILSIQSHVVSGYCGNKSATFPLQLLEFEVDIINSVQLSNHTQYKVTSGQIFDGNHLDEIANGLEENNLTQLYDNVISGYVAHVSYIHSMAKLIKTIKQDRKAKGLSCCYTLDPVLGDDGVGYYVPNSSKITEAYKDFLLPLADIITPNRFEASALSGVEIEHCSSDRNQPILQAMKAIKVFHDRGIRIVIITSFEFNPIDLDDGDQDKYLTCIVSYSSNVDRDPICEQKPSQAFMIKIPKLDCPFTGTGDLFAALMTGWLRKTNFDIEKSLENTANSIHSILEDTLAWSTLSGQKQNVHSYELRLVQNRSNIIEPNKRFKAEKLNQII